MVLISNIVYGSLIFFNLLMLIGFFVMLISTINKRNQVSFSDISIPVNAGGLAGTTAGSVRKLVNQS